MNVATNVLAQLMVAPRPEQAPHPVPEKVDELIRFDEETSASAQGFEDVLWDLVAPPEARQANLETDVATETDTAELAEESHPAPDEGNAAPGTDAANLNGETERIQSPPLGPGQANRLFGAEAVLEAGEEAQAAAGPALEAAVSRDAAADVPGVAGADMSITVEPTAGPVQPVWETPTPDVGPEAQIRSLEAGGDATERVPAESVAVREVEVSEPREADVVPEQPAVRADAPGSGTVRATETNRGQAAVEGTVPMAEAPVEADAEVSTQERVPVPEAPVPPTEDFHQPMEQVVERQVRNAGNVAETAETVGAKVDRESVPAGRSAPVKMEDGAPQPSDVGPREYGNEARLRIASPNPAPEAPEAASRPTDDAVKADVAVPDAPRAPEPVSPRAVRVEAAEPMPVEPVPTGTDVPSPERPAAVPEPNVPPVEGGVAEEVRPEVDPVGPPTVNPISPQPTPTVRPGPEPTVAVERGEAVRPRTEVETGPAGSPSPSGSAVPHETLSAEAVQTAVDSDVVAGDNLPIAGEGIGPVLAGAEVRAESAPAADLAQTFRDGASVSESTLPNEGVSEADERLSAGRMIRTARMMARNLGGTAKLVLQPPSLGTLRLDIVVNDQVVSAALQTQTWEAHHLVANSLPVLREALERQGLTVGDLSVATDDQPAGGFDAGDQELSAFGGSADRWNQAANGGSPSQPTDATSESVDEAPVDDPPGPAQPMLARGWMTLNVLA